MISVIDLPIRNRRSDKEEGLPGIRVEEKKRRRVEEIARLIFNFKLLILNSSQVTKRAASKRIAVREKVRGMVRAASTIAMQARPLPLAPSPDSGEGWGEVIK